MLIAAVVVVPLVYGSFFVYIWWIVRHTPPGARSQPAQLAPRTVQIINSLRGPSSPALETLSADLQLELAIRNHLPPDAEVRVVPEGWANSISIYVRKVDFQEIPFPDRRVVLRLTSSYWCASKGHGWFTSVNVRDIRTGETLESIRCSE